VLQESELEIQIVREREMGVVLSPGPMSSNSYVDDSGGFQTLDSVAEEDWVVIR
jgi:hypothetical protein